MNLATFTDGQRKSVEHLDGPLLVSAGAGSGKTFTLAQRIAYALLPESGPFVEDIDQVMAITFTEKAAGEIKARVKRTLASEGLHEQALRVDGAWISTIHGACARILRAHALELGIDPGFAILSEAQRGALVEEAVSEAIDEAGGDPALLGYGRLFAEYDARSKGASSSSVRSMLEEMLGKASGMPDGFGSFEFGPAPAACGTIARRLLEAYRSLGDALVGVKPSPASEKASLGIAESSEAIEAFLESNPGADDYGSLAGVLDGCCDVPRTFGTKDFRLLVADFQTVLYGACAQTCLGLARPCAELLLRLARRVRCGYERRKLEEGALDNDDLLVKTLAAFSEFPQIADLYRSKFKLVMVDEFQDTSQLQVDLVAFLAGENLERLCTVGDAQQSIYRFRGADVNVYESHKRSMARMGERSLYVELSRNFRSHRDILSFVDRIFEQDRSFGKGFMSLTPNPGRPSKLPESAPRIQMDLCTYGSGRSDGLGSSDAARASAKLLAQRFAAFRDAGCSPSSMVVLLGRMSNAGVYASALRDAGFECVIAGGSSFGSSQEAAAIAQLLRVLANPLDTQALFQVLASGMFSLTFQDLLLLATDDSDSESPRARSLAAGVALAAQGDVPEGVSPLARRAISVLAAAREQLRDESAATVARRVVAASGWLLRLERQGAQGRAQEANVLKALRLAASLEKDRKVGPASLARAFEAELAASKEPPGALSGGDDAAVRIMTIHASKGLEFPIVGVGEFVKDVRAGSLVAETVGRRVHVSLKPSRSGERWANLFKLARKLKPEQGASESLWDEEGRLANPCDAVSYRLALEARLRDEELAEGRRKLYVALTRASEALVVEVAAKSSKGASYKELVDDFRCALFGDGDFPDGESACEIGADQPCFFRRFEAAQVLDEVGEGGERTQGDADGERQSVRFSLIEEPLRPVPSLSAWDGGGRDTVSYTMLSSGDVGSDALRDGIPRPAGEGLPSAGRAASDEPPLSRPAAPDGPQPLEGEKATDFGIAFHRVAELFARTGGEPGGPQVEAIASLAGLKGEALGRLRAAAERWFASDLLREARRFGAMRAEVPFIVPLEVEGRRLYLEGEIDLLCDDGEGGALVVDYKTGGSPAASDDELLAKHSLQASCYAYGLLAAGFRTVDMRFAYVELAEGRGEPRTVRFRFGEEDEEPLSRALRQTIARSTL